MVTSEEELGYAVGFLCFVREYVKLRVLIIEYLKLFYAEMNLLLEDRFT